jgi:hypothetical protein
MPIRSRGEIPAGIRDLGLPGRAVTALTRAGVSSVDDLAMLTRRDLAVINGLGPSMIAAIRVVVPEPPASVPRSVPTRGAGHEELAIPVIDPEPGPAEDESPEAPVIPSFGSLRAPRGRTSVDVLIPERPPVPPASSPVPAGGRRPAEYADLLRLGARVVRAVAGVPGRTARWAVGEPVHCLRQLLGGQGMSLPFVPRTRRPRGRRPHGRS